MDFEEESGKRAKDIALLLEKNGYDDTIIILRKGPEVAIAVSNTNSEFAPDMLHCLYEKLDERLKIMFAIKILGINVGQMITEVLDDEELRGFLTMRDEEDED